MEAIRSSTWWETASRTPDRHDAPSEGVSLADHQLLRNILVPVALLHDIGKLTEDKTAEIPHYLENTGKWLPVPSADAVRGIGEQP